MTTAESAELNGFERVAGYYLASGTAQHAVALLDPYLADGCGGARGLDSLKATLEISSDHPLPQ